MGLIRTYVDAGVLIAAARSASGLSELALAVLDDPTREFVGSEYLRLEVLPRAHYHRSATEIALYEEFFSSAALALPVDPFTFRLRQTRVRVRSLCIRCAPFNSGERCQMSIIYYVRETDFADFPVSWHHDL